jgi:hypothetical protein
MTTSEIPGTGLDDELRQAAIKQLRKKRDFQSHLLAYVLVNLFLNGIWWLTSPGGFYWPLFPMLGWGIGLAFHGWDAYGASTPTEESIQAEMARLGRR